MIGSVLAKVICYLVTHFKAFIGVMSMLLLITILLLTCYFLSLQRKDNIWRWWNSCVINVSRCSHYGIPTGFLCCFITFSRSLFFYFSIFLIIFKHLINLLEGMQHFNITSYSFIFSGFGHFMSFNFKVCQYCFIKFHFSISGNFCMMFYVRFFSPFVSFHFLCDCPAKLIPWWCICVYILFWFLIFELFWIFK